MPTPTIETAAPSSAPDNVSSQTTPPEKTVDASSVPSGAPAVEPRSALSAFGAAIEAVESGTETPPEKLVVKTETKPKTEAKPTETKPADGKKPEEVGDLPKLDSKSLLKKEEAKSKEGDKTKPREEKVEEQLSEDELKEELDNPHRKEKSQRRYRQLWEMRKKAEETVATTVKQVKEREEEIAKLKEQMKVAGDKAGVPEEVQKQLEELAMMKREKGLADDPQVKQLFDSRVASAEGVIMDILTKRESPLPKSWVDAIKESGGFIGFSKTYPAEYKQLMETLPVFDVDQIKAAMFEQSILGRQKTAYIEGEKAKAVQFFADQKAKADAEAAARPDPRKEAEAMQGRFGTWKEGVKKEASEIFGQKEIPADASETVRKQITEQNKFAQQLSTALDQRVAAKSAEEWQDILLEAVLAHKFAADSKALRAENEALKAELEKVRGAGRTVTRGGATTVPPVSKETDGKPKSFAEAMEESLHKLEGAQ